MHFDLEKSSPLVWKLLVLINDLLLHSNLFWVCSIQDATWASCLFETVMKE